MCAFIIKENEDNTDNIVRVPHTLNIPQPPVRVTKSKNNQANYLILITTDHLVSDKTSQKKKRIAG